MRRIAWELSPIQELIERGLLRQDCVRTAWHEAGHAVIAQVLGMRVRAVTIVPDAASLTYGRTAHDGAMGVGFSWERWRAGRGAGMQPYLAAVLVAMAGHAAESLRPRVKGQRRRAWQGYRGSGDSSLAWWHLEMMPGDDALRRRRHARLRLATEALVRRHRVAIARVAEALLVLDSLDDRQIEAVIPVRRLPVGWYRPEVWVRREQIRELATLLRAPGRRLTAALLNKPDIQPPRQASILERKKPPIGIRRVRKSAQRCYELTWRAVDREPDHLILVHGDCPFSAGGTSTFDHAWILDITDNTIFDTGQWRWYHAAEYPGVERVRYTDEEKNKLSVEHGMQDLHMAWGPYDRTFWH